MAQMTFDDELQRIVALPRRAPLDLDRRGDRTWAPSTADVIRQVTARFTRGLRVSCACQPRLVRALPGGRLLVLRRAHPKAPPPEPLEVDRDVFLQDAASIDGVEAGRSVEALRAGMSVELPGRGRWFCFHSVNAIQAVVLDELPRVGGLFGLISVGGGKTILGILAPMTLPDRKQAVIFAKPDQRIHYRNAYLQLREHFRVPNIVFDRNEFRSSSAFDSEAPVLHVVPYSQLSNTKSTLLLSSIDPKQIYADEVHLLGNRKSSRTMRFLHFMAERNVVFAGWSGSAFKKSIKDVAHLVAHALGLGSPFPIFPQNTEEWAQVTDPSPVPITHTPAAKALRKIFVGRPFACDSDEPSSKFLAGAKDIVEIREAHRDFIIRTPGIISTRASTATASMVIREREVNTIPKGIVKALAGVRQDSTRPDGEELVDAMEIASCARGIGAGYFNYWAYPNATDDDRRKGGRIDQWFAARKAFYKELRSKLLNGEPHLDSPSLCINAAERAWRVPRYEGDLPVWPAEAWPEWAAIKDTVEYVKKTRWVDDYLAQDAAAWARENTGIVWVLGSAFGHRVAELAGTKFHRGGPNAEAEILAEDGSRSIVVSMKAHSEGRDGLQERFHKQLMAELPASADRYEQTFGRLTRDGQIEDTVETWIYQHTAEYRDAFEKAFMIAEWAEQQSTNLQQMLAADGVEEILEKSRRITREEDEASAQQ